MAEINNLDVVDNSNTKRWPENMFPDKVNDSARAIEGMLARWHRDNNGSLVATGTDDYTITLNSLAGSSSDGDFFSLYNGLTLTCSFSNANTGASTLNLTPLGGSPLGVKAIVKNGSLPLVAGDIKSGAKVSLIYDGVAFQVISDSVTEASETAVGVVEKATTDEMAAGAVNKYPDAATIKAFVNSASGVDQIARDNLMTLGFQVLVNGNLALQNLANGFIDEFEDESGVDTGDSSGQLYSNGVYKNSGRVSTATPSAPKGGTAANMNDASDSTTLTFDPGNLSGTGNLNDRVVAKLDLGSTQTVNQIDVHNLSVSNGGYVVPSGWGLYTSTDGSSWSILGADFGTTTTPTDHIRTGSVSCRYVALIASQNNINTNHSITQLNAHSSAGGEMTLLSQAMTASAAPATIRTMLRQKDVDAVTLNTDLTLEVSRDGGTTWTAATLTESTTIGDTRVLLGDVDVSGQPSGTSLKYRVKALNSKAQEVHGISQQWSF